MTFTPELIAKVQAIGPAGFRLVSDASITDRENDFVEGMPQDWVRRYIERNYAMGDPVFLWAIHNSGVKRWSEISIDDFMGVMEDAKAHGLGYGLVISRVRRGRFSVLSVARNDREYSDDEISQCQSLFDEAMCQEGTGSTIKPAERAILQALSEGMSLEAIAAQTSTPISTVKTRLKRACVALDAKTSMQAVARATRLGLI